MKQMRGTLYLSACRQTVSDCGCTPATASNTATAPSSTRRLRSTSTVKSTCPGVSMMLMRWSRQNAVVAADVIVMPRSCSWAIQSIVAAPRHLDGHLVVRTADSAAAHFEDRRDRLHGLLEHLDRRAAGLGAHGLERLVDDLLGNRLLAVEHDLVDHLRDELRVVDRIRL